MAEIRIQVGFDDKGFGRSSRSLQKSTENLGKAARGTGQDFDRAGVKVNAFGSVLKGVLTADFIRAGFRTIASGIQNITTDFATAGDQVAKTSDKLGVGIEALQELRFAAERSGVATTAFDVALQRLTRRAAEAAGGTGVALKAFEQLNVQLRDSNGNVRATEDIFGDLAEAFQGVETQSERVRLAFQLFDTEGVALVNVLNQGREGVEGLRDRARELGFVIGEDSARASERFVDALTDLEGAFGGLRNVIGSALLPALTDLIGGLTDTIIANRELFQSILNEAPRIIERVVANLVLLGSAFAAIKLFSFAQGFAALVAQIGLANVALVALKRALAGLGIGLVIIAVDLLVQAFLKFKDEVGGFGNAFEIIFINVEKIFLRFLSVLAQGAEQVTGFAAQFGLFEKTAQSSAQAVADLESRINSLSNREIEIRASVQTEGSSGLGDQEAIRIPAVVEADADQARDAILGTQEAQVEAIRENEIAKGEAERETFLEQRQEKQDLLAELKEQDQITEEEEALLRQEQGNAAFEAQLQELTNRELALNNARRAAAKQRLADQVAANRQFLLNQQEFGTALAQIDSFINSRRVREQDRTFNDLQRLTTSNNKALIAIGKASAVRNIAIDTARGATAAYQSLAGIPFVGPALGIAAAAALIAFGAEQTANVLAANEGGLVPGQGSFRGDIVPSLLTPGELVTPAKNFDEVVDAVASRRAQETELQRAPELVSARIDIGFEGDEAAQVLTARQIENEALGLNIERAF